VTPQQTIAHYKILAKIGEGGMGVVYRGIDTKLGREVAVKVLPDAFANNPDRLTRFTREAQVLASLNHPNIAAIYGVEERALIMEMVEGATLAERIASGPLRPSDVTPIIDQLIDALEYAHSKGVIHRDLKPANIKVTHEGKVKVLDFGLAKAMATDVVTNDPASSPTITMGSTTAGTVLGTAAYMAPEQARGHDVDKRADIWAFGVVVYETVTGTALFTRPTVTDTLAAVLKEEPDWKAIPNPQRRLLRSCLSKDPRRRLRDIGDARALLEMETADPASTRTRWRVPLWVAAFLSAALVATGTLLWQSRAPDRELVRVDVDLGPELLTGVNSTVAISPDGRRLVFPVQAADGKQLLGTRRLDEARTTLLAGTVNGIDPFFSPDGMWVGFFADGKLKKISVNGGASVDLCAAVNPRGGSWGRDGYIVASLNLTGPLFQVPETGGTPKAFTKLLPGEYTHRWPQFLDRGDAIIFTAAPGPVGLEDGSIDVLSLKTGRVKALVPSGYFGRVLPSGHLLYEHLGVLFGIRFDFDQLQTRGIPRPLFNDVAANPLTGGGEFDFAAAPSGPGTLVYLAGKASAQSWQLGWLDKTGNIKPLVAATATYTLPRFSPDGRKLVFVGGDGAPQVIDLVRGITTRLTSTKGGRSVVWANDGRHIVVGMSGALRWIRSDGVGEPVTLIESKNPLSVWSFSPDGHWLAYFETLPETGSDIWVLPLDTTDPDHPRAGTPQSYLRTPANEYLPRFSTDGRWIAYRSDETGSNEIWVMSFPAGKGEKSQISIGGGLYAFWSKNGRELFYEAADHRIMVVDYQVNGDSFEARKPRVWSERQLFYPGISNLDLAPDGRFAVLATADASNTVARPFHLTMLFNYFDELKRMIP
jgi:Tol biopolymer transport system component/predicted Ser/Thr protein kinase